MGYDDFQQDYETYSGDDDDIVEISAQVKHETDKALLIIYEGDEIWLPKSQIEIVSDKKSIVGRFVELEVPEWLAKDKELI